MIDKLNGNELIELHEKLDVFAQHHQSKGAQQSHKLVKDLWDQSKKNLRDGSREGLLRDQGYDNAFQLILSELQKLTVNQ